MVDFGELFKYPMRDEKWIEKILIGGVINIVPIVNFISMGYSLESMESGAKGESILPVWEDWGNKFMKGLMAAIISLVFMLLPVIIMVVGTGGVVSSMRYGSGAGLAGGGLMFLSVILMLVIGFFLPMALANYIAKDSFGAAFEFGEIMARIKNVAGDYAITFVVLIAAYFVMGLVSAIPILGFLIMMFGSFYLNVIFFNAFGRLYSAGGSMM